MQVVKKYMWWVVLPWKSFPIVGALMTKEEAEESARLIWPSAYCE